jgi:hypothetical protein
MRITRSQLRNLILEATIDYIDNDGKRIAVKADGVLGNNNLRLQLQGYYNDVYDEKLKHQQQIMSGQYPDLAKELAHKGSYYQAMDDFQEYLENTVTSKYGNNSTIKFGEQDFIDEQPSEFITLSDIISNMNSDKIKYKSKFRDFPDPKRGESSVDYNDHEPLEFKAEPITPEDELQQAQRLSDIEQRRRELGSDLSFMFDKTVPRADYPDETTTPKGYMNLEDLMADEEPPTWMNSNSDKTEPPQGR